MTSVRREWLKSSFSGSSGDNNCVELDVANFGAIRDSKNPDGPILEVHPAQLAAFINQLKNDEH